VPTLTFTFDTGKVPGISLKTVVAEVKLKQYDLDNFFELREIARKQKNDILVFFTMGIPWETPVHDLESGSFVVNRFRGVALNANAPHSRETTRRSHWIDWGMLDLINIMEDTPSDIHAV
jgi:hypothetical protein